MRASVDDPALQKRALDYLRQHPMSKSSEVGDSLGLNHVTCDRLLLMMASNGQVKLGRYDLTGRGRPARLFSASPCRSAPPVNVVRMTPDEMAADIATVMARQPWPTWLLLPGLPAPAATE